MSEPDGVDWEKIAMLLLWDAIRLDDHGLLIERFEEGETDEHEIALVENAFRDWMWAENGRLINYR